jgi:hypothetical protein
MFRQLLICSLGILLSIHVSAGQPAANTQKAASAPKSDEVDDFEEPSTPPKRPSSIGFTSQFEETGSRTNVLSGTLVFQNNWSIFGSVGSSHDEADKDTVTAQQFSGGFESDSNKIFSAGLSYDIWGLEDTFDTKMGKVPLYLNLQDWTLNFTPGSGKVSFTGPYGRTKEKDQTLTSGSITYIGFKNWSIKVAAEKYHYDFDLSVLQTYSKFARFAKFFSSPAFAMSSSLVNSRGSLEVVYSFQKFDLGIEFATAESAFDKSIIHSGTLEFDYYVKKNWVLSATGGSSKVVDNGVSTTDLTAENPNHFGSLGVKYKFY